MPELTRRQQQILDFIQRQQQEEGVVPSFQEIADHFGFRSVSSVADHLSLIRKKGFLNDPEGRARALTPISPLQRLRKPIVDIPVFGSIPAGIAENRQQEARGCVSIDVETLGLKPSPLAFGLEIEGDSMIGKHIAPGDLVLVEPRIHPKHGDVVVALIDGESTLKTLMIRGSKTFLHAENPKYPDLIPAGELVIQGVAVAFIRKCR